MTLVVKIPTEDFTDETLEIDDTHGDDVRGGDGVLVMEVNKVADEVTAMEVDKMSSKLSKIPILRFSKCTSLCLCLSFSLYFCGPGHIFSSF